MARMARVVVPGIPHHITQRGNRRLDTFFADADYREYLYLMAEWCNRCKVQIWAYCLMSNHIHLIAVPESEDGLRRAIGEAHRRFTRYINFQKKWKGHLWQGRLAGVFFCFVDNREALVEAFEFKTKIKDGMIQIPRKYRHAAGATVKVIILTDHGSKHPDTVGKLLEHPVKIPVFTPLSRDEIYERI